MKNKDISDLLNKHNETCVSVIAATHELSPERRIDERSVKRVMEKARRLIETTSTPEKSESLLQKLDQLWKQVDFVHNQKGIGFFVSESVQKLVRFPFSVREKAIVDHCFELRDLLYLENFSPEYLLLDITGKKVRLFRGVTDKLAEIQDDRFPRNNEDEYEYARPARATSYTGNAILKQFEKDKSEMQQIRIREFLHETDEQLQPYLSGDIALIVSGTAKDIALFETVSRHPQAIVAKLTGNNNYTGITALGEMAWLKIWAYVNEQKNALIKLFEERLGEGRGVAGMQPVWEAAQSGRGLTLMVEYDYSVTAFTNLTDNHLYLDPPGGKFLEMRDVISEIILAVLEKGGDVWIMENGMLNRHGRIGLITRY